MVNFQGFGSAIATTAPHVINPVRMITNIVDFNNYETLYWMFLGRSMADVLRAGSDVRKRVKFKASSKAGWYNVQTEDHDPQIGNDGTWLIAYWCAHMAQESWKEEELLANAGGVEEGSQAEETYVSEVFNKLQSLQTQLYSSFSTSFWDIPNFANMGGNDPLQPYSIPVYLNEMTNGLFNPGTAGVGGVFTEIHGINPADARYSKYIPHRANYGAGTTGFTEGNESNVIRYLSSAIRKTGFKPPPVGKEYFDNPEETDIEKSGGFIATDETGVSRLEHLYRSSQSEWANWMDPAGQPVFHRVPIVYEAQLDTAPLYNHAASNTTKAFNAATITGPRYYGINAKRMVMYWHKNRFLKFLKPFREAATTYTQHVNSMGTMFCEDRSKHFLLSPAVSH